MDLRKFDFKKMSVLLADDHTVSRYLIRKILDDLGFATVTEVSSGKDALEIYFAEAESGRPFDLLITDWMMPDLNGIDLVRNVRAHPSSAKLAVLMTTASSGLDAYRAAASGGVDEVAFKPVKTEIFVDQLEKAFDRVSKRNA